MAYDYELLLEGFYRLFLRPGDNVVDVGAHVGRHAFCIAQEIRPGGSVFLYEPPPQCRDIIRNDPRWAGGFFRIDEPVPIRTRELNGHNRVCGRH